MKRHLLWLCFTPILTSGTWGAEAAPQPADPWESTYAGEDATGKHVIGLWKFDAGKETEDSSGHGHTCVLEGASIKPKGRFGSALESARGWPVEDKRHRAMIKAHPDLSPKGPFTIEMWICPNRDLNEEYPDSILLDKKYASQNDYQLSLGPQNRTGTRSLRAWLGFGADSSMFYSRPMRFEAGTWHHIAFTYDGAGTGAFYVDGLPAGSSRVEGRKHVSPGTLGLSIGDRVGSYHHGFPGLIDEVRICNGVREFRRVRLEVISDRTVFLRMEPAILRFVVTNLQRENLAEAVVGFSLAGQAEKTMKIVRLASLESKEIEFPLDTHLRPDSYQIAVRLSLRSPRPLEMVETFKTRIVPRPLPDRFPVVMWGGVRQEEIALMKELGFNHAVGVGCDFSKVWQAGKPTEPGRPDDIAQTRALLDEALANDFTVVAGLSPGHALLHHKELLRVNRIGQVDLKRPDICGLIPEIQKFCYNVGASVGKTYGRYPAFGAALIHTEVRDAANLCFHPHDFEAYRKATGRDTPPEVVNKHGVDYKRLPAFPASRVIPDDHPIYTFFKWFWKQGDGWNELNSAVHRGIKEAGRPDIWTFHDPAVRVARVFGSGGQVDYISQWTYSYPDPIRIGLAADELLATAAGAAHKQQIMKMTQIIWYRTQTAPLPKPGAQAPVFKAPWEIEQPDAPFITISPMHLREAFWTKIARPVRGIMYHGWGSLVPTNTPSGYRFTHPQTQHELARLVREVVRPLGPTLLQVPPVKSDVAFLECFASEMFAHRGTYGWGGGWAGDAYHVALWAHLQPEIIMDETIIQRGLDGFRVLIMCDCDVITQTMAERIRAFQAKGGIIVGDERITPAIKPDVLINSYKRTGQADVDRAALVTLAGQLRSKLDARYHRYLDSSNPDVIPYRRAFQGSDYVFVVNDKREYGEYVGQHGLVMENGLPSTTTLSIGRTEGIMYDLIEGRPVAVTREGDRLAARIQLGPCDGRLYLVCPRPIASLNLDAPRTAGRGSRARVSIEVRDSSGKPIEAVVPVEVTIRDAESRIAEFSGNYAAVGGRLELVLDIAANDPMGAWQIEARELASGQRAVQTMRVPGPTPWPPARKPIRKELVNPVQPTG
jgi:hypothetical protein